MRISLFENDEKDWIQIHNDEGTDGVIATFAETVS